jgi:hypothetical protein
LLAATAKLHPWRPGQALMWLIREPAGSQAAQVGQDQRAYGKDRGDTHDHRHNHHDSILGVA